MHAAHNRMVNADHFSMVPRNDVPRSAFDVQHTHKTTLDAGQVVPVYVDEVLPGDSFNLKVTALVRASTPSVPFMDNMRLDWHFFFCPTRLVWDNWQRFMGELIDPTTDTTVFLVPQVSFAPADLVPGGIADYMGITTNAVGGTVTVNALPFRAYNRIWNEFFRDQDLMVKLQEITNDGPDAMIYAVAPRCKRHDYFTSARPFAEKALNIQRVPGVLSPILLGQGFTVEPGMAGAPVTGIGFNNTSAPLGPSSTQRETGSRGPTYARYFSSATTSFQMRASAADYPDVKVLINDLRTAAQMQNFLEKQARGGTRYTEILRSHFGVVSPDARLQRPEYLGGGSSMVSVSPVAQTSASGVAGTSTVMGELAGVATSVTHGVGFSGSFTEHGYIIGMASIRGDLTYQQGVNRMWFRRTQFDFYWPSLAHLGEQAILSKELWMDGTATDENVFGFQERWAEYKYKPSRTSGAFRSTYATPLDKWHLGQKFSSRPVLNTQFVREDPPIARVLQVNTNFGEQFLMDAFFDVRMVRPMPMFSIPGLGGAL